MPQDEDLQAPKLRVTSVFHPMNVIVIYYKSMWFDMVTFRNNRTITRKCGSGTRISVELIQNSAEPYINVSILPDLD